jgi:hypothetical protein
MGRLLIVCLVGTGTLLLPLPGFAGNHEVANQIVSKLYQSPKLRAFRIAVKVEDGTALLVGTVTSESQRQEALSLAKATPGVARVRHRLTVAKRACRASSIRSIAASVGPERWSGLRFVGDQVVSLAPSSPDEFGWDDKEAVNVSFRSSASDTESANPNATTHSSPQTPLAVPKACDPKSSRMVLLAWSQPLGDTHAGTDEPVFTPEPNPGNQAEQTTGSRDLKTGSGRPSYSPRAASFFDRHEPVVRLPVLDHAERPFAP